MHSTDLQDIAAKVHAGERLGVEDGVRLYSSPDIHTLGELANIARERFHGRKTFYNINRHINYTNYCVLRCRFCSFCRPYPTGKAGTPNPPTSSCENSGGYELSVDEIVQRATQAAQTGATEVHIVGGLHPRLPFSYYLEMCRRIREAAPQLHIKAFTAIEIIHFSRITKPHLSIREVLEQLHEAGLGSLPGGGAEIFDDRVHSEAFKTKVGQEGWFDVHRTAHELGLFSNATMLYGHIETIEERVRHLVKLRSHQDDSLAARAAHFNCIVPLSFIPHNTELQHLAGPTGLDDLRTLAVCRLMLDNFSHVKAFWIMQTPKLAQVSLNWGVDDFDGTVVYYDITKHASHDTATRQELTVDQIQRFIYEAGGIPTERDSLYGIIQR
ncbi:MAG TPA: aminofutalosine synthase MqnE [Phycisphaerae bacterium]|nr:aminofutalosine synthase MqnE [Phycisphaerae bacterium]HRY67781.1 aminofutalosine synthase MqnE [Phycisphaerae bacterium]HSA25233.1 aminofutalosine synthase MqnE [Phycisphaerae bacterium]